MLGVVFGIAFVVCAKYTEWCVYVYRSFSYDGERKLSKQIIDGTAGHITLPEGGVGLFLSYPPKDVRGFIDHCAGGFKCTGLWKVYGDEEKTCSLFTKYKKCTEIYCTLWQSGLHLTNRLSEKAGTPLAVFLLFTVW